MGIKEEGVGEMLKLRGSRGDRVRKCSSGEGSEGEERGFRNKREGEREFLFGGVDFRYFRDSSLI